MQDDNISPVRITKIIASPHMRNSEIVKRLEHFNILYSSGINADFIFNDCQPSLALKVIEGAPTKQTIQQLEKFQTNFRSCFAMFYNIPENDWYELQYTFPPGRLKMIRVRSFDEVVPDILNLVEKMSNKAILDAQVTYFRHLEELVQSPAYIKEIVYEIFQEMNIEKDEVDIVISFLPTFSKIVRQFRYPVKEIEEALEARLKPESMNNLQNLLGTDAPTLKIIEQRLQDRNF